MAILSASDTAILQWVVDYLRIGGAGSGHIDQKVSDELARVFRSSCSFRCGCPGSFQDGLRDSPVSTLLRAFICVADVQG
ncbi:hypothetical protein, partial [Klebsiella pneumoniae]|uniref:hypothetical protein n=1 Tax=Klebsiella pneumoniae TaxID=573 RepID=UPI001C5271FE